MSNLTNSLVLPEDAFDNESMQHFPNPQSSSSTSTTDLVQLSKAIFNSEANPCKNPYRKSYTAIYPVSKNLERTPSFPSQGLITLVSNSYKTSNFYFSQEEEKHKVEEEYEDLVKFVTKEDVERWNKEVGNLENDVKVNQLIARMRKIGGLDPSIKIKIDISEARMGLSYLAGTKNQENKMWALNSLLEILNRDNYSKKNSEQLIDFATELLNLMAREKIQTLNLEAQNKIGEVYNVLAETLNLHFGKRNINGITEELKRALVSAAKSISDLNRLDDAELKFNMRCALEGVRRIKDDRKELFKLVESIYHTAVTATALYMHQADVGFDHFEKIFKGIDPRVKQSWYSAILILKNLAQDCETMHESRIENHTETVGGYYPEIEGNENSKSQEESSDAPVIPMHVKKLIPLFLLINEKSRKLNWKFTYAAVDTLFKLALTAEDKDIRHSAFFGFKQLGFHGLFHYARFNQLKRYPTLKPIIHLESPHFSYPSIRIRQACFERLKILSEISQDELIRERAARIVTEREQLEL